MDGKEAAAAKSECLLAIHTIKKQYRSRKAISSWMLPHRKISWWKKYIFMLLCIYVATITFYAPQKKITFMGVEWGVWCKNRETAKIIVGGPEPTKHIVRARAKDETHKTPIKVSLRWWWKKNHHHRTRVERWQWKKKVCYGNSPAVEKEKKHIKLINPIKIIYFYLWCNVRLNM
jgi:hypothetical protein